MKAVGCAKSEERVPDPEIFLCIPVSDSAATTVNPNNTKTLAANGLSTFIVQRSQFSVIVQ